MELLHFRMKSLMHPTCKQYRTSYQTTIYPNYTLTKSLTEAKFSSSSRSNSADRTSLLSRKPQLLTWKSSRHTLWLIQRCSTLHGKLSIFQQRDLGFSWLSRIPFIYPPTTRAMSSRWLSSILRYSSLRSHFSLCLSALLRARIYRHSSITAIWLMHMLHSSRCLTSERRLL